MYCRRSVNESASCSMLARTLMLKSNYLRYVGLEEPLPLSVISAFVRLGMKYDIRKLCIEGQRRIFTEIPADLAKLPADYIPACKLVKIPEHWFELVIFARMTGLLSILPFALYICCKMHTTSEIIAGARRSDGTIVHLSIQDQITCLAGYQAMCKAQADTTFSWAYARTPTANCTSTRCAHIRVMYLKVNFTSLPNINGLEDLEKLDFRQCGLCSLCADQAEEMHKSGRKKFWALLPSFFSLPPWEELCKEREEV